MKKKGKIINLSLLAYLVYAIAFASSVTGTPKKDQSVQPTAQIENKDPTQYWQQWHSNQAIIQPLPGVDQLEKLELAELEQTNTLDFTDFSTPQNPENITNITNQPNETTSVEELSNSNSESDIESKISTDVDREYSDPMGQVTSVNQLSDVQPTDWAFQALQSLVERYGCIAGYPDGTFRGNRSMTRYEFAAGLNACLDRIQELIAAQTSDLVTQEDLAVLQRLQENFAAELAQIRGRILALEARTASLESQQFSTTTKLSGQIVMHIADAFGREASGDSQTVYQYRSRMTFKTSFTGTDALKVGVNAGNSSQLNTTTDFPRGPLSGRTAETVIMFGNSDNEVRQGTLSYSFQVNNQLRAVFSAFSDDRILSELLTPVSGLDIGPVSNYGRLNTMLFPVFLQAGAGFQWNPTPWFDLDFFAGSESGSASRADIGRGLFNGGYGISTRAVFRLDRLNIALVYIHSYSPENGIDTESGSNAAAVRGAGPVVANTYVSAIFYRFSSKFVLGTSGAFTNARTLGRGTKGDAHAIDYRLNIFFPDLFKEGNIGGMVIGIQPRLNYTSNDTLARAIGLPRGQSSDRDTGWHLEAFYTHRVNDYITITPGFFWLTAPNHDERNPDVVVGVLRTTFNF
ncbi:MAG: iron uptake porin [Cyanobacteria bacterium J06592_8]